MSLDKNYRQKIWQLRLSVICLFVFVIVLPALAEPQAIQLEQTHCFLGRCLLTMSATGIRLESKDRLGFVLVSKAPDWAVTVYRNDDKTYFTDSYKQFCDTGMISGFIMKVAERNIRQQKSPPQKINVLGFKATRLVANSQSIEFIDLGNAAPQAEHILQSAYKMPTNGAIPLEYIKIYNNRDYFSGAQAPRRPELVLRTTKITRITPDKKLFDAPKGYKLAKSIRETVAGSNTRTGNAAYQELFDMNFDSNKTKDKRSK